MDAILYIRFSTAEQKTGDSYDRQRRDGLAYIEKMGWRHTATIEDLGKSAWKGEHMLSTGALGKLSAEVAAGDIGKGTVIVAEKTDRLSREGWEPLFDWLRDMTRRRSTKLPMRSASVRSPMCGAPRDRTIQPLSLLSAIKAPMQAMRCRGTGPSRAHRTRPSP